MRFEGTDYILTLQGFRQIAPDANEIGTQILEFVRKSPVDCHFDRLIESLLSEYDVERTFLEEDVRAFVLQCIEAGALTEPGKQELLGLDLSITNRCNATCVYCPTPRLRPKRRLLGLAEVGKLIDDLLAPEFEAEFGRLSTIEIGGLTEPLLNRRAIDILREFKQRYPTPFVILYTNAVLLTPEHISSLLREQLITSLVVSVDGMNHEEHFAVKGVPYATVERNLRHFLRTRDELGSECRLMINVLTFARYRALVRKQLNRDPLASYGDENLPDNTDEIIAKWKPALADTDEIHDASDRFQLRGEYRAKTDEFPVPEEELRCPWPEYVAQSLSVTSNGDVLICCNDFRKESVLGNFLKTSLHDIAVGPRRRFIEKLTRNELDGLPLRCRHRKYCQPLTFEPNGDEHDLQG